MDIRKTQALRDILKDKSLLKEKCYIDGKWVGGTATIDVTNPVDESVIGTVPKLGAAETRAAIEAAQRAQKDWAKKTAKERAAILRKWFNLMMENQEDLAQIMTAEQGKPLAESRGEVAYGASFIEFFAEEGKRIYGETIPSPWPNARMIVIKQPVGVVAAITPWNFPNAMITRKAGPALAAGCAFVCKPANETPLSALALAELAERAGIPAGVFSVITGVSREIGAEMTSNPIVRALTFTGSTEVGRVLMAQCAPTIKKVGLELGGNAPFIVFDDADLDAAVQGAMMSKYRNAGQTCVCANRILVQEGVYDAFAEKLAEAVKKLKVGDGTEAGRHHRPAHQQGRRRQGAGAHRRRGEEGRQGHRRRQVAGRQLLRADPDPRRHDRHGRGPRGDLRSGGAAVQLQDRGRGDRHGQQHRVRPCLLFLFRATSAASGALPKASNMAWSASTRASSRRPKRRSAASRSRASAAKARTMASRNIWK